MRAPKFARRMLEANWPGGVILFAVGAGWILLVLALAGCATSQPPPKPETIYIATACIPAEAEPPEGSRETRESLSALDGPLRYVRLTADWARLKALEAWALPVFAACRAPSMGDPEITPIRSPP